VREQARAVCVATIALGALSWARPLEALDPARAVTQYVLESWIAKDGAPEGTITSITQTPDRYLWLATEGEDLHETADGAVWNTRHWEGLYQVANETLTF
jgi:hypothetical protein